MNTTRFKELLENVQEAVDIHTGRKAPERVYVHPSLDVKAIRGKLDLSQDKFAALLGISRRTLEGWEQGRRKPTGPARQLLRVANRFPDTVYQAIFDLPSIDAADGTAGRRGGELRKEPSGSRRKGGASEIISPSTASRATKARAVAEKASSYGAGSSKSGRGGKRGAGGKGGKDG